MKLSIIIPVYNEEKTLLDLVKKVEAVDIPLEKEIILVDDCSEDNSREIIKSLPYKHIFQSKNSGKGSAVCAGLAEATGDYFIIQDSDLEYDPNDYKKLLPYLLDGTADVVYGSRFMSKQGNLKNKHFIYFLHNFGNWALSWLTSILYFQRITDMETCYKMFSRKAYEKIIPINAKRFDLEPILTAKFRKAGFKIYEVPISYYSRGFDEGKKITWRDGIKAVWYLVKYRF